MTELKRIVIIFILGTLFSVILKAQIDTTGLGSYRPLYNSMKTWDEGAFNMNQKGHPDYGWCIYNSVTHNLEGSTTYLIKLPDGSVKRIFITLKNSVANIYYFLYSDIDGQNEKKDTAKCVDYVDRLFIYYSIQNGVLVDREPANDTWDFVLTKYHDNIIDYDVTGFLLNEKVKASVYKAPDSARAMNSTLADTTIFSDSLTVIGNSWYNLNGMVIEPNKKNVYFVKTRTDTIYRFIADFFESGFSGEGRVGINSQLMAPTLGPIVYDTLIMGSGYANDVYYHFKNKTVKTALRSNWDLAFKTYQMSACILANTTIGDVLYTYPNWYPVSVTDKFITPTRVYPNPSYGPVYLSNPAWDADSEVIIQVFNTAGQAILSRKQNLSGNELILDLSEFTDGLYHARIASKGKFFTCRILKSR